MDHIVFIRSNQSNSYYPSNKPFHFKVYLNVPLYLEGQWEVSILDFYSEEKISSAKKNRHQLFLFCDACMGVNVFHNQYSLLRRIFPTSHNNWNYAFSHPIYVPVKKTEICEIEIHIFDEKGEEVVF